MFRLYLQSVYKNRPIKRNRVVVVAAAAAATTTSASASTKPAVPSFTERDKMRSGADLNGEMFTLFCHSFDSHNFTR